jgi:hypothetical protein
MVVEDLIHKELLLKVLALTLSVLPLWDLTWQMQESLEYLERIINRMQAPIRQTNP